MVWLSFNNMRTVSDYSHKAAHARTHTHKLESVNTGKVLYIPNPVYS